MPVVQDHHQASTSPARRGRRFGRLASRRPRQGYLKKPPPQRTSLLLDEIIDPYVLQHMTIVPSASSTPQPAQSLTEIPPWTGRERFHPLYLVIDVQFSMQAYQLGHAIEDKVRLPPDLEWTPRLVEQQAQLWADIQAAQRRDAASPRAQPKVHQGSLENHSSSEHGAFQHWPSTTMEHSWDLAPFSSIVVRPYEPSPSPLPDNDAEC